MVQSNLKTCPELLKAYTDMQKGHKSHWLIMKAEGDLIVVDQDCPRESGPFDYSAFVKAVSIHGQPRYAVLDYPFMDNGVSKSKLVFILWCPDDAPVGMRMRYASSKDGLKKKLNGLHKDMEAHDEGEIEESNVLDKVLS